MTRTAGDNHGHLRLGNLFSRATHPNLTALDTNVGSRLADNEEKKDKRSTKRSSTSQSCSLISPEQLQDEARIHLMSDGLQPKSRTSQKGRPNSVFGSLGRKSVGPLQERPVNVVDSVLSSPIDSRQVLDAASNGGGKNVLHHGEVQTTSGLFRKKKEYLVLTDTHLIRYKSQSRASEAFPSISSSLRRSNATRHVSTASIGSLQDLQSLNSHVSLEGDNAIPLRQIVAAYKAEDGRPFFTTEVVYLDEESNSVGSMQLMLSDPMEADLWHTSIRGATQKARLITSQPFPDRLVRYVVHILESAQDYDVGHFQIFRVVRRTSSKFNGKSSSDDLAKLGTSVFYMVIGINQLHIISLPEFGEPCLRLADAKSNRSSHGLVTLVAIEVKHADDSFQLGFRNPLQPPYVLDLAAASSPEIAGTIFKEIQYLKPQWLNYTFLFGGPRHLFDDSDTLISTSEDNGCFERSLVAYCSAYNCNPGNIRYAVDLEAEDSPEFRLMPPALSHSYSILELLAVFRALRYNESFRSISFQDVNLHKLHGLVDTYGEDHIAWTTRSGLPIRKYFNISPADKSLLYQEVQALALKTNKVRRVNFSNTLPGRRPRDEEEEVTKDPGCEITSALLPLCRAQLTNVDWIVFNGIELGEADLEEFTLALNEQRSHIRCLEVSHCGLSDRGLQVFLTHIERQHATMECINISDNPGKLHLGRFPITMSRFSHIRKLDLSRATSTAGTESLITPEVMLAWRLEELIMAGVPVNGKTLDAISTYLASSMSDSLHCLQMDQCNLTGAHVAALMRAMSHTAGEARSLHLHISANRLEKGNSEIVKVIEEGRTPSHLIMRMVEYQTESRFRQLLQALRTNTTIRSLDISKASLPYDAGDETCEALRLLFEENTTLEELDISGEHAHLEVARFGIGLNHALTGLKKNKALKVLRIEYQNLGLEGANTLSSVLEQNKTLAYVYCDHNDLNLQGFTVLVNGVATNLTVLGVPTMINDQRDAVRHMVTSFNEACLAAPSNTGGVRHSVRRTLTTLRLPYKEKEQFSRKDLDDAVKILNDRWQEQVERLTSLLARNQSIAAGLENLDMHQNHDSLKPTSALSDVGIMEHVLSNRTPRVEVAKSGGNCGRGLHNATSN